MPVLINNKALVVHYHGWYNCIENDVESHASIYVYVPLALSHFFRGRIDEHIHTTPVITAGLNEQ